MTPLCCVVLALLGGGFGWQLIGGVNISNASPEYLQPERVISGRLVAVIIHKVIFPVTPPVNSRLSWELCNSVYDSTDMFM